MRKYILGLMLTMLALTSYGKCDWSNVRLTQTNNRSEYRFYLSGINLDDPCIDYMYIVYTVKNGQIDTMSSLSGTTDIIFNEKGKYRVYLKIWDHCKNCDTSLVREVNLDYFNQCKYSYKMSSTTNTCNDSITAEMSWGTTNIYDTCWSYYQYIFNGPELDSLTQYDWDSTSDQQLYNYYGFSNNDVVKQQGPQKLARILKYKFPKEGRYLIVPQWVNKCTNQDTFMFRRITIETCNSTSVKTIIKDKDLKVVGYYDMLGRPVNHVEDNVPYILLYDNGQRKKIIKVK